MKGVGNEDEGRKAGGVPFKRDLVALDDIVLDGGERIGWEAFDEEVAHIVTLDLIGVIGLEELVDEFAEARTVGGDGFFG